MKKQLLNLQISMAEAREHIYFGWIVDLGNGKEECSLIRREALSYKASYWGAAYSDDLVLKANPAISITAFASGDCTADLVTELYRQHNMKATVAQR